VLLIGSLGYVCDSSSQFVLCVLDLMLKCQVFLVKLFIFHLFGFFDLLVNVFEILWLHVFEILIFFDGLAINYVFDCN